MLFEDAEDANVADRINRTFVEPAVAVSALATLTDSTADKSNNWFWE